MTNKVTAEDVFAAADAMVARGEEPTQEKIRALLERGSMSTINKHLKLWRTKRNIEMQTIAAEFTFEQQQSFLLVMADLTKSIREDFEAQLGKIFAAQRHQEETQAADLTAACDEADRLAAELVASQNATRAACEALEACKANVVVLHTEYAAMTTLRLQDQAIIAELRYAVAELSKMRAMDLRHIDAEIERRIEEAVQSGSKHAA